MTQTALTHHLAFPFEHDGAMVTSLTFRRPNGGDIRRAHATPGSDFDRSFKIMANLAEVEMEVIDKMDPVDIDKVQDWLEPILDPKGRLRGSPS